jgi:hypothetical protein
VALAKGAQMPSEALLDRSAHLLEINPGLTKD